MALLRKILLEVYWEKLSKPQINHRFIFSERGGAILVMSRKKEKLLVKIREEATDKYFAYFVELRRLMPLNEAGAKIVDAFFNKKSSVKKIAKDSGLKEESVILKFLEQIKGEINCLYEGGYPIINNEQLDVPIAAELQVVTKCNLRCKHCCQSSYDKEMPMRQLENILRILAEKNVFEINLVGGEFFLHPNALEIIRQCCLKYNFATTVITNGTFLTGNIIEKLEKFKNNLVFLISLEGVEENNDKIRGQGVFVKVDKAIKNLKRAGFYVEISSTINNVNISNYQEIVEYSDKLKVPVNFNLFKPFKSSQESLIIDPQKYFLFIDDIFRQRKKTGANLGLTNAAIAANLTKNKRRKTCRATLSGLTIDVNGKMIPCAFLGEIGYYGKEKLPKFGEDFLEQWQNNKIFNRFRKGNTNECQACSYIFNGAVQKEDPYGLKAFLEYKIKAGGIGV